jgi:hypothetical protein
VVGIVLGVSMAPTKVRMVLVEGENADGVTVDQDHFDVAAESSAYAAPAQVISAILGTREGAAEGGYQLLSSGVTFTDHVEAAMLRDALVAHKIENVMLVSAFMAAAALAQAVGDATNYAHTALLFVEPYTATLAVVNTADGSISDVRRQLLPEDEDKAVAEPAEMVSAADSLRGQPEGVFVVGSGVDIPLIKPALDAATSLQLSAPEEPEMALARGAALASANAPLFASSTAALAYAQDPGTGEVDPLLVASCLSGYQPGYLPGYGGAAPVVAALEGKDNVAYSALPDEDADANTGSAQQADDASQDESPSRRRPIMLLGSGFAVFFISAVVALEIALAISIRPTVALRPSPNENLIVPTQPGPPAQASVPKPKLEIPSPVAVPKPLNPPVLAPIPAAPPVPAPVPVVVPPVLIPMAPNRVPAVEPPRRGPVIQQREPFGGEPRERGPFGAEPREREPFGGGPRGGGEHGGFGGPFGGGHGGFGGPFGGGHGGFGGPFGGGHGGFGGGGGFGGFGGGHGGFGHR